MTRKRALLAALVATGLYLAVAYGVLPELWRHHEHAPTLAAMPKRTATPDGLPGDPLNLGLVGSEAELVGAFARTGWRRAAALGLENDLEIGTSVIRADARRTQRGGDRYFTDGELDVGVLTPACTRDRPSGSRVRRRWSSRTGSSGRPARCWEAPWTWPSPEPGLRIG